jgi:hypothetical protein
MSDEGGFGTLGGKEWGWDMAWKNLVAQALTGVVAPVSGAETLQVADDRRELRASLTAIDRLACAFDEFRMTIAPLAGAEIAQLKERASKLAARLNYLLEPIGLIEVDAERCYVQMRSIPPQKDEDRTTYYELLAERGGVFSLRRYEALAGAPRAVISAEVTREVFLRLADDFGGLAE